jgi:hypothetical protein
MPSERKYPSGAEKLKIKQKVLKKESKMPYFGYF